MSRPSRQITAAQTMPPIHMVSRPTRASTVPEAVRTPRSRQRGSCFKRGIAPGGGAGGRARSLRARPVAPVASGVVGERAFEMRGVEVRPEHFGEQIFGVGGLPEQEVRDPAFAAGAYDQ